MKKSIKQLKQELSNFAGEGKPLTKRQLLGQKCSIINKEFFGGGYRGRISSDDWKDPEELIKFLKELGDKWIPIWQENDESIPPHALKHLIYVLSYLSDETGRLPAPKSIAVSFPAEILKKYSYKALSDDVSTEALNDRLISAVYNGNIEKVDYYLSLGAEINPARDRLPLYYAKNAEMVQALIDRGADPNFTNDNCKMSPLRSVYLLEGNYDVADALIKNGAEMNFDVPNSDGDIPIVEAAKEGNLELIKFLLAHGADINAKNPYNGVDALSQACLSKKMTIIKFLLSNGANVDNGLLSKLVKKASFSRVIKLLVETGAVDVNATCACDKEYYHVSPERSKPLLMAVLNSAYSDDGKRLIQYLISKGADVNATDNIGWTPLMVALGCVHESRVWLIPVLLEAGADPYVVFPVVKNDKYDIYNEKAGKKVSDDYQVKQYLENGSDKE